MSVPELAGGWLRFVGLPGEVVPLDERGRTTPVTIDDARTYLTDHGFDDDQIAVALGEAEPPKVEAAVKDQKIVFKVPKRRR